MAFKVFWAGCLLLAAILGSVAADSSAMKQALTDQTAQLGKFLSDKAEGILTPLIKSLGDPVGLFIGGIVNPTAIKQNVVKYTKIGLAKIMALLGPLLPSMQDMMKNNVLPLATDYSVQCIIDFIKEFDIFCTEMKAYIDSMPQEREDPGPMEIDDSRFKYETAFQKKLVDIVLEEQLIVKKM